MSDESLSTSALRAYQPAIRVAESFPLQPLTDSLVGEPYSGVNDDAVSCLVAAMASAAVCAARAADGACVDPGDRKRKIDGAATQAAERCFGLYAPGISVTAGEGAGDDMPGALVGQRLGGAAVTRFDGIFDYVDGTTLAARKLPGALSLGALGSSFRPVPDLQALALMVPSDFSSTEFDLRGGSVEEQAPTWLEAIADSLGKRLCDLTVLVHSTDSGAFHSSLIVLLNDLGVRKVLVPNPVVIEAPYILSMAGLGKEPIDTMLGVYGLPELAFVSALLDLFQLDFRLEMTAASNEVKRSNPTQTSLGPLLDLSSDECAMMRKCGLDPVGQFRSTELTPRGAAMCAAVFAVSPNEILDLHGVTRVGSGWRAEGMCMTRHAHRRLVLQGWANDA